MTSLNLFDESLQRCKMPETASFERVYRKIWDRDGGVALSRYKDMLKERLDQMGTELHTFGQLRDLWGVSTAAGAKSYVYRHIERFVVSGRKVMAR